MVTKTKLKIYKIKHDSFHEHDFVLADNVNEAIDIFMDYYKDYYKDNYDVKKEQITSVVLEHEIEVIKNTFPN